MVLNRFCYHNNCIWWAEPWSMRARLTERSSHCCCCCVWAIRYYICTPCRATINMVTNCPIQSERASDCPRPACLKWALPTYLCPKSAGISKNWIAQYWKLLTDSASTDTAVFSDALVGVAALLILLSLHVDRGRYVWLEDQAAKMRYTVTRESVHSLISPILYHK